MDNRVTLETYTTSQWESRKIFDYKPSVKKRNSLSERKYLEMTQFKR